MSLSYVKVNASADFKDMLATWQVGFDSPTEDIPMELYINAVFDLVAAVIAKAGQEFTLAGIQQPAPTPSQIVARIGAISAAITAA